MNHFRRYVTRKLQDVQQERKETIFLKVSNKFYIRILFSECLATLTKVDASILANLLTCIIVYLNTQTLHICKLAYLSTSKLAYLHNCQIAKLHTFMLAKLYYCILVYFLTCILSKLHTYIHMPLQTPILAYLQIYILTYLHTCMLLIQSQVI